MVKISRKPISIIVQAEKIRRCFPKSKVNVTHNKLVWRYILMPSPMSEYYDVKLEYRVGGHPCVYVVNRKLELFPGKEKLPHTYDSEKQFLCLYRRDAHEWNDKMFIAETIIPWISEWLYHYEFWLATGKWYGGGIHGNPKPFIKEKIRP